MHAEWWEATQKIMPKDNLFIGIHAGHDANVSVIDENGVVLFAAGEERFNREKMYAGFPKAVLEHVLSQYRSEIKSISASRMNALPKMLRELGFFYNSFRKGLVAPRFYIWLKQGAVKVFKGRTLESSESSGSKMPPVPVTNVEHHYAHAASAFYPSGFDSAYIMTLDGEGDGYSCCFYKADMTKIKRLKGFYHNEITIGRDYEKVTAMLGFHPLRHPGKITGLAAYGQRNDECIDKLTQYLLDSWKTDRSRILSTSQAYQVISTDGRKQLISDRDNMFSSFSKEDIAYAIQYVTEQKVLELIRKWIPKIKGSNITLAGGVFANVALNKKIKELGFDNIFIQPAMTDAGLSLGSLLYTHSENIKTHPFSNVYFGTAYTPDQIKSVLNNGGVSYTTLDDPAEAVAQMLADGKVVAEQTASADGIYAVRSSDIETICRGILS